MDIISSLVKMKYEDHYLLLLKDIADEPYESVPTMLGTPILWIPHPGAQGLDKSGLLGLINMPHFGRLNKANACVKQLLACFHGGKLWLNEPIQVTVDLIANITRFPKVGEDLTQYFRGQDNDKKLSKQLKERFGLQRDGQAYCIDSISSK